MIFDWGGQKLTAPPPVTKKEHWTLFGRFEISTPKIDLQNRQNPPTAKIVKSIFLGRFSADFDVWVLKMRRMTFLTRSSLQNVKKRFHEFMRAQIRFFH